MHRIAILPGLYGVPYRTTFSDPSRLDVWTAQFESEAVMGVRNTGISMSVILACKYCRYESIDTMHLISSPVMLETYCDEDCLPLSSTDMYPTHVDRMMHGRGV